MHHHVHCTYADTAHPALPAGPRPPSLRRMSDLTPHEALQLAIHDFSKLRLIKGAILDFQKLPS